MSFFLWLEGTGVSEWIRGSPSLWAFPFILYLHTLGLALIAGLSSAVALCILAAPDRWPRPALKNLFPLMWVGLAINVASGLALLVAYPAKALTNPVFYIKLVAIAGAVAIVQHLERQVTGAASATGAGAGVAVSPWTIEALAKALLGLWAVATLTGRLLAYTHSILLASFQGLL